MRSLLYCLFFIMGNAIAFEFLPVSCIDVNGIPVSFVVKPQQFFTANSVSIAMATQTTAFYPTIMIDSDAFNQFPPESQLFILAHECAHHQNGDVIKSVKNYFQRYNESNTETAKIEERADCVAKRFLSVKGGFSAHSFDILYGQMLDPRSVRLVGATDENFYQALLKTRHRVLRLMACET